jgi:hypothetical protein
MQFATRSKETVLADLTHKLRTLPASHPDRAVLTRMIADLRSELADQPAPSSSSRSRDIGPTRRSSILSRL